MKERNTVQRELILEAVGELKCHPTADDVYSLVAEAHPSISRGTVYRNLNKMSDDGEIRRIRVPDGADRYDHDCSRHYHIKCSACGRVFDVDMDWLSDIEGQVRDARGFEISGHDIMFSGVCPDCLKKDRKK